MLRMSHRHGLDLCDKLFPTIQLHAEIEEIKAYFFVVLMNTMCVNVRIHRTVSERGLS